MYDVLLYTIYYLVGSFAICFITWLFYLAVMTLARAKKAGKMTKWGKIFGMPLLGVGYLLDMLTNVLVCSVIFLEFPRELLVTARVSRHKKESKGWRYSIANWVCGELLDPYDYTDKCHCK